MDMGLQQRRVFRLRPPLINERFMLGALQRPLREGEVAYAVVARFGLYSRFMIQAFGA